MIGDPSIAHFLFQSLPLVTRSLDPESLEALTKFVNEVAVVLTAHGAMHLGADRFDAIRTKLLSYAQKGIKPPENHDLQRAFYVSFLRATEVIYLTRLQQLGLKTQTLSWVTALINETLRKLRSSPIITLSLGYREEKEALTQALIGLRSELDSCSNISLADLEDRMPIRPEVAFLNKLTLEVKTRGLGADNEALTNELIDGSRWYKPLGENLRVVASGALLECMSAFFAEEIKTNPRVQAILNAEILAGTNFTLDTLVCDLRDAKVWLEAINKDLAVLKEEVSTEFRKVFRVVDTEFLERQKSEPVTPFLSISRGDWALVAQGRSMERDLAAQVAEMVLRPNEKTVLQIIRGEPGSGKTTLLLQVGAKLVCSGCTVLEVLPAATLDEFQYFAKKLTTKFPTRLFVLIDDIYRDEDRAILIEVLSNLGETLPLTLIATTPSFADRTGSIRENSYLDKLPTVSPDRLTDTELAKLRQLPMIAALSARRFKQLAEPRKILVVMLQLTLGKPIDQILSETADKLNTRFPDTYRAWGVAVVFSRHNLPVPGSLLDLILDKTYFSDALLANPRKMGSEGIIFPSSYPFRSGWFAGHAVIARFAFCAEFKGSLRDTCEAAVRSASPSDHEHSMFLGRMLRFLSAGNSSERELAISLTASYREKFSTLASASPAARVSWGIAFLNLGRRDQAEQCLATARPDTPGAALSVVRALEELGKSREAIFAGRDWCDSHLDDTLVRTHCLRLLERTGLPEDVRRAITQTADWLAKHDQDTSVRTSYLGLVERWAQAKQVTHAITQTADWLAKHDQDTYVRTFYLGLVERKAQPEQVIQAITQTADWLAEYDQDTHVRTFYLGLVERKAQPEQVTQAITQTKDWLARHDQDTTVRTFYLGLVERAAAKTELNAVTRQMYAWLQNHPGAKDVWRTLIAVLTRSHDLSLATEVAAAAISSHPGDLNLIEHYLDLIASEGPQEDVEKTLADLQSRFPRNYVISLRHAKWLSARGKTEEAEAAFYSLGKKYPRQFAISFAHGQHLLGLEKWSEAKAQFDFALYLHQGFPLAHERKALALRGLAAKAGGADDTDGAERYLLQAEQSFRSAIYFARIQATPTARFYTQIGWFYLDQKRCKEALASFDSAIGEDPEHFSNYWGKGAALKCLGKYAEAMDSLNMALSKAPQPFEAPASEEIPRLIEECKNKEKSVSRQ